MNRFPFSNLIWIGFFTLFTSASGLFGQSTESSYTLNLPIELIIGGIAAGGVGAQFLVGRNAVPLTDLEILALDRNNVNGFDRPATYRNSRLAFFTSDIFLATNVPGSMLGLFLMTRSPQRWKQTRDLWLIYWEGMILNLGVNFTIKNATIRTRPFVYNTDIPIADRLKGDIDNRRSFYSAHASWMFYSAAFVTQVYSQMHADNKWKYAIGAGTFAVATFTAYLRFEAGMHFPTDIAVGALTGTAFGLLLPALHRKRKSSPGLSKLQVGPAFFGNGLSIQYRF